MNSCKPISGAMDGAGCRVQRCLSVLLPEPVLARCTASSE